MVLGRERAREVAAPKDMAAGTSSAPGAQKEPENSPVKTLQDGEALVGHRAGLADQPLLNLG